MPASHHLFDGGFWRNIIVRSNEAGDHLAIIITNPGNYTPEQISEQERLMKDYFSQHAPSLSLFHQSWLVETIFLCGTFFLLILSELSFIFPGDWLQVYYSHLVNSFGCELPPFHLCYTKFKLLLY